MYYLFQVALNFDPVKKILKIQCCIYILMEKEIILRKIHVTMKSFAPPFSTLYIETKRAVNLLHKVLEWEISIGANVDFAKMK